MCFRATKRTSRLIYPRHIGALFLILYQHSRRGTFERGLNSFQSLFNDCFYMGSGRIVLRVPEFPLNVSTVIEYQQILDEQRLLFSFQSWRRLRNQQTCINGRCIMKPLTSAHSIVANQSSTSKSTQYSFGCLLLLTRFSSGFVICLFTAIRDE